MTKVQNLQEENRKVNRACYMIFNNPDGRLVLDALRRQFAGVPLKKSDSGFIDPNAVMAAAGSNLVIKTIEEWIENGELAR
jgi:hypothetical protein